MGSANGGHEQLTGGADLDGVDLESFYRVALAACKGERDADEIADRAVVRYVTSYKGKSMSTAHRLIRSIVACIRIDDWRRAARTTSISTDPAELQLQVVCDDTPEDLAMRAEIMGVVREGIAELPLHLRVPLTLRVMQGMTFKDISERIDVPVRTIENRVTAALKRLRAKFKSHSIGAIPVSQLIQQRVTLVPVPAAPAVAASTSIAVRALLVGLTFLVSVAGLVWFQRQGEPRADADVALAGLIRQPSVDAGRSGDEVAPVLVFAPESRRKAPVDGAEEEDVATSLSGATADPPASKQSASDDESDGELQRFQIRIVLNGEPSPGWKSRSPLLDPDAQKTSAGEPVVCKDRPLTDEDGIATFDLPVAAGKWRFALESPISPLLAVWVLIDPASVDGPLEIDIQTGKLVLEEGLDHWPGYDLSQRVLESNPQPGVWVLSGASGESSGAQGLVFPHVAIGQQRLRVFSRSFVPDMWPILVRNIALTGAR